MTVAQRRWTLWSAYVTLWTIAILAPIPRAEPLEVKVLDMSLRMLVAKTVHLLVYAGMAVLGSRLLVSVRYRFWLVFFMMGHASAAEFLQLFFTYRSGQLTDVLINQAGVGLGLLASWKNWSSPASVAS